MNCRSAIGHVNDEDEKKLWTVSYSGVRQAYGCRRVPAALMPVAVHFAVQMRGSTAVLY